jgi:hypothetical protein
MRDGKYENVVAECTAEIDSDGEHSDSARLLSLLYSTILSVITHNLVSTVLGKISWILCFCFFSLNCRGIRGLIS